MEGIIQHPSRFLPEALTTTLRATALEAEHFGYLHPEQLAIIDKQGWFHALTPKVYGGLELCLPELLKLEEALAWADGSVGWVVTLCSGAGWFGGFLDPMLAAEIFLQPQACIAGSGAASGTASLIDDGYVINGFWKYASGALHATAFTANCQIQKEGQPLFHSDGTPIVRPFLFKKEEVQLHTTWKTMGMIATASHAFEVTNVVVPANRCFSIEAAHAQITAPIYHYPFLQLAETTLAVNILGMAIRFVDLCMDYAERKTQHQSIYDLLKLAEMAQQELETRRKVFYTTAAASWVELVKEGTINPALLSAVSTTSKTLVTTSREWVNTLYPHCGLEAADKSTELNRVWRNLHTAGQHALLSPR